MKKGWLTFGLVILGLYLGLHLILGSRPIQKRVVEEISRALAQFGFDLTIESIEFSAFTPKIYLNRVTIRSRPNAEIQLVHPLPIDKIKIEFQPLALIARQIVIEEVALFNPRLTLPSADKFYKKVNALLKQKKPVEVSSGSFTLVLKKFGFVDAVINIASSDPQFAVRSRSLSAFVQNSASEQQTVTVQSRNLEIDRGKLSLNLSAVDVDIDVTKKSLRVNRAIVEGDKLALNVKGVTSVPQGAGVPSSVALTYDVKIPLDLLSNIPELGAPALEGVASSSGNIKIASGAYSGSGQFGYESVFVDGYRIGNGSLAFGFAESRVTLSQVNLAYGGGNLVSKSLVVELKDKFPIQGELVLQNVKLEGVLDSVKSPGAPVRLILSGPMKVHGTFHTPFELTGELTGSFKTFAVLDKGQTEIDTNRGILYIEEGKANAVLNFSLERMSFQASLEALDGKLHADGFVSYDNAARVNAKGEGISLTKLGRISQLRMGGKADLFAEVDVVGSEARITGAFEVAGAEVAGIALGDVKGQAFYQNQLLSFENLEALTSLDPVKANGFVDFNPDTTHYKFHVEGKRIAVSDAFKVFQKKKLSFQPVEGGEVSARLSIEGGHDDEGIEVITSGQAKNINWYGEDWINSTFFVSFRPKVTDVKRLILMKKAGGLEVKARYGDEIGEIKFHSHGLRIEELKWLGRAPIAGEVAGEIAFKGDLVNLRGNGDLKLVNSAFRGEPVADSSLRVKTDGKGTEVLARLLGESFRARIAKPVSDKAEWEVLTYFDKFDMAPAVTALLGRDIPTVTSIQATGDLSLKGVLGDWKTFRGSGSLGYVNLGLKGTPMSNQKPVEITVDGGSVSIPRIALVGRDSQLSFDLFFHPDKEVRASLDGKVDLQFVQPFIPGLEYGAGKVSAGLRLTGRPDEIGVLGNILLEDGTFRLTGINDEFRNTEVQLSLSQDRLNVERFESKVNGGTLIVEGDVKIDKFKSLIPNLALTANRIALRSGDYLTTRLSGEFTLKGAAAPYILGGKCRIHEAKLTKFDTGPTLRPMGVPAIKFDIKCDAKDRLFVTTDVMDAEFKGGFNLLGNSNTVGLLGTAEAVRGVIFFRERNFKLNSANVRFESSDKIAPRFSVAGSAIVNATRSSSTTAQAASQYEVNLQAVGTPSDYKIILTSSPELSEPEIISLLLLGATRRGEDGNYMELGTTLMGQLPIQSKLESELGLDVQLKTQPGNTGSTPSVTTSTQNQSTDTTVPSVSIKKDISDRTKVSYSNTLENLPTREFRIEHMLDDNLTVNGTAVDRTRGGTESTQSTQSYGLEIRYRYLFE